MTANTIPVIDLFAGPGGLGEGFSAFTYRRRSAFNVSLSIEKEFSAYRTLFLRSFFRKIPFRELKCPYLDFAKSDRSLINEKKLYSAFKAAKLDTKKEVICKELGSKNFKPSDVDAMIKKQLNGSRAWVLIGGPPCQAYSIVGRARLSQMRKTNIAEYEKDERHYLYQHYLRIIAQHEPPVFVMENVKGMLSSSMKGKRIIDQIVTDLKNPAGDHSLKYNLYSFSKRSREENLFGQEEFTASDFVIKAEEYGIPQNRHRVIILGVRSDISAKPEVIEEECPVILKDVISDLPEIRSEVSFPKKRNRYWADYIRDINKVITNGSIAPELSKHIMAMAKQIKVELSVGKAFMPYSVGRPKDIVGTWYRKHDLGGITNHEARCHMPSDLQRYFFAACFAQIQSKGSTYRSPILSDFPLELLPNHQNINPDKIEETVFSDRFRVQLWNTPGTTITSHISKDGHYFIHPDPRQCRSLTVREAARIQTFPDSYIFLGTRTNQYQQVGNAVPPLLAKKLAGVVFNLLNQ